MSIYKENRIRGHDDWRPKPRYKIMPIAGRITGQKMLGQLWAPVIYTPTSWRYHRVHSNYIRENVVTSVILDQSQALSGTWWAITLKKKFSSREKYVISQYSDRELTSSMNLYEGERRVTSMISDHSKARSVTWWAITLKKSLSHVRRM